MAAVGVATLPEGARESINYGADEPSLGWPEGLHRVWHVTWRDDHNISPRTNRFLEVCPPSPHNCERAGLVSKRTVTIDGQEETVYDGWIYHPTVTSPIQVVGSLLEEGRDQSNESNAQTMKRSLEIVTPTTPVPEPSVAVGLPAGLILLAWLARKRLRRS